jgi:5-methylcytosine-specific restriction endonuclease McrA
MADDQFVERFKNSIQAAKTALVRSGHHPDRVNYRSAKDLCSMLGLRYATGVTPKTKKDVANALIDWYLNGGSRTISQHGKPDHRKNRQDKKGTSEADLKLLRAAAARASKHVKRIDKAAFNEANNSKFLSSKEWKATRLLALQKYGNRCMACGITPNLGAVLHVDHIKPRRLYPRLALDVNNLQILCEDCNEGKANWSIQDFRPKQVELKPDPVDLEAKLDRLHSLQG